MNNDDCYEYRKKIGLPVTKKLIYKDIENNCHIVRSYMIIKEYNVKDDNNYWAILEIYFKDDLPSVRIHTGFFSQMQNKNFKRSEQYKCIN